jgi:Kef-type K+ transport system membrane component KefB/mannitol/fructose-specific phosphotransferase system IIA component (Ntr-type)
MQSLSHHDVTILLLSLGILLVTARLLGDVAHWLRQPAIVGEILAGVLLGPTVLGVLAPEWEQLLFPTSGAVSVARNGLVMLATTLFLLVAGMEVDLSSIWRQGTMAVKVGIAGLVLPFAVGLLAGWFIPGMMGRHQGADPVIFALFFATALSISALPVIAKLLMDLNLYRSDVGMMIVSAAVLNDLIGWIIFATILGLMGGTGNHGGNIGLTITLTLGFATGMLTLGRWLIHRSLPYIQAYSHGPGGVLSFALSLALFGAAFTEWVGVHAIFGSFLVGVAVGDSSHLRERTRTTIDHFVSFIFAPLFFGSIGLKANFFAHFEPGLVVMVLFVACFGKILGCWLGGIWAGLPAKDRWAVGYGMNARGAMEIILGLLALEAGVIRMPLFVALIVMAVVTSMMSGPLVQLVLGQRRRRTAADFLSSQRFVRRLSATTRSEAIRELVQVTCESASLDINSVTQAVLDREDLMHTGIGHGLAIPHARIDGLSPAVVAVGFSEAGVDFDAPDGEPTQVIFLILTSPDDGGAQLELISSIAGVFKDRRMVDAALASRNLTEFLAILRNQPAIRHGIGHPA